MKKVHPDGRVTYYYYKKKQGRHKKPGPKPKKKKELKKRGAEPYDYKVLQFDFHKQTKYISHCRTLEDAMGVKQILEEKNESVIFPKKYVNNYRKNSEIYELKSEYVILKKNRTDDVPEPTQIRNEYGKFVSNKTTSKKWIVYDKFPCLTEETFWVYGHNPYTGRKEFKWIYDNFVIEPLESFTDFVIIYLYNNKVIFRYDNREFNFVICKNIPDAIRMYNLIEEWKKKDKRIIMSGSTSGNDDRAKETVEMIKEKTGWTLGKIYETSTRH